MALDDDIATLAAAPLFGLMDRDALRLISFAAERLRLAPGAALFERGAAAECGYVVLSGSVRVEARAAGAAVVEAGPAAVIGQTALLAAQQRPSTARAGEAGAEVMVIPRTLMRRVLEVFPVAAAAIHDALAEELAALVRDLSGSRAAQGSARRE
ncbi:MAG: cyclic nucleotide-binding domain-containing protein [Methylobacterium frigidaeris]